MTEMLIEKEKEISLKLMVVMVLLENTMIEVKTGIIYVLKNSKCNMLISYKTNCK